MATFPESPAPIYPLLVTPVYNTRIAETDGGKEQRRQKLSFPKFDVTVRYNALTYSHLQTLWDFYMARKGAYEAFYVYDLTLLESISFNQDGLYAGTGDGSTEVFDIPGRSTSSVTVYKDGVEQTLTTDYVLLTGGGASSADRIDFVTAPSAGEIITVDFTGYLRIRARFAQDRLTRELFIRNLFSVGIELKGLAAA